MAPGHGHPNSKREQGLFDPAQLVFVDETAVSTNMARLCGRCDGDAGRFSRKWLDL
jgi:hypothetical protein